MLTIKRGFLAIFFPQFQLYILSSPTVAPLFIYTYLILKNKEDAILLVTSSTLNFKV